MPVHCRGDAGVCKRRDDGGDNYGVLGWPPDKLVVQMAAGMELQRRYNPNRQLSGEEISPAYTRAVLFIGCPPIDRQLRYTHLYYSTAMANGNRPFETSALSYISFTAPSAEQHRPCISEDAVLVFLFLSTSPNCHRPHHPPTIMTRMQPEGKTRAQVNSSKPSPTRSC